MPGLLDLNADVGESFGRWTLGDDAALLTIVTSANVACGFHAGDPSTLRRTCAIAAEHGVAIGAQVSYRDLAGFGRRFVDVEPDVLRDDVLYQIGGLDAFARAAGSRVTYVKPHGALYHATAGHVGQATAVVAAVAEFGTGLAVLGAPGSRLLAAASDAGLLAVAEAFADRGYAPDGSLVPRSAPGALLHDVDEIAARISRLLSEGEVVARDGTPVRVDARSVCVHGDTPGAVAIARAVREAAVAAGATLQAFAPA